MTTQEFYENQNFPKPKWCTLGEELPCVKEYTNLNLDRAYGQSCAKRSKCAMLKCKFYNHDA